MNIISSVRAKKMRLMDPEVSIGKTKHERNLIKGNLKKRHYLGILWCMGR